MNELVLPVVAGILPTGTCFSSEQERLSAFSAKQSVTFPSTFSGVSASQTKPTDTTQAWLQLDTENRPTRLYYFANGAWLSLHPSVPGTTMIWTGGLPDFTTFDGGDSSLTISATTGPMWQVVLAGTFPVGAGPLTNGPTVGVGNTGGSATATLTTLNIPQFTIWNPYVNTVPPGGNPSATNLQAGGSLAGGAQFYPTQVQIGTSPVTPLTTLPPYTAVYYLMRSARLFYSVI